MDGFADVEVTQNSIANCDGPPRGNPEPRARRSNGLWGKTVNFNEMSPVPTSLLHHRVARRVLGALVLALQVVFIASAMWEPRPSVRLGTHVEQPGTRHAGMHDEASCTVCAVRTMHAPPAERVEPEWRMVPPASTVAVIVASLYSRDQADPGLSRAPPVVV